MPAVVALEDTLHCFECDYPLFPGQPCDPEEHAAGDCPCDGDGGFFWHETQPTKCPRCGGLSRVMVDGEHAYVAQVEDEEE